MQGNMSHDLRHGNSTIHFYVQFPWTFLNDFNFEISTSCMSVGILLRSDFTATL